MFSFPPQTFNNDAEFGQTDDFKLTFVPRSDDNDDPNVLCMEKVQLVEETVFEEELRCNHVYTQECHDTYLTEMGTSLVNLIDNLQK